MTDIYTSNDSGVTWVDEVSSGNRAWTSVASSGDGKTLAATGQHEYVYTSTDSGATWNAQTSIGIMYGYAIASSADGARLVVALTVPNVGHSDVWTRN